MLTHVSRLRSVVRLRDFGMHSAEREYSWLLRFL